ncbi:hypothetical protein VE03_03562 [Pseudogymnoascus sp. 23342-1-I1]|nr:hypothetical protein VE03_03691 [Pseudogymnoascus sp. 23342-1-I1]OBT66544.1 hypothetical protein VE03_03562 [Pseudogymnoascus sp. 23342-1-I1]
MRPNLAQDALPPKNRPGAPSVGFNNKRLRRLVRAVCANVPWKYIPTVMEEKEDGFTPKLSTCREYFLKITNMPPGKVANLEDKDAQRGRQIRMFDRLRATRTPSILVETPDSVKDAKASPGIIDTANESSEDLIQGQPGNKMKMAETSTSPDNKESIIISNADNDPAFKSSGTKRPNLYTNDSEGVGRFLHKYNDGRALSSLESIPAAFVPGHSSERPDEVGEGLALNTARNRPQKTIQEVENEMKLPPGSSDVWRWTRGSSIYSSSRPSTIKSSISSVLDEPLPSFGQDDTSGQLSLIPVLFQLFEKSRPDAQITSDLRTLLLQAGDAAARALVNTRNESRKLPLEFAIERGLYGACRELLQFGADVGKRSSNGTSLSKFALRTQRDAAEDLPKYSAVGLCYKLLMDYSTAPNAKTIKRRARQGSIAKRDSLSSIPESFTNPRPAPLPPVSHQHFSSNSTGATTIQLNLPENRSFNPTAGYRPPVERQQKGVSKLINHFDTLGSNEGSSSSGSEARIHRQPDNEDNVWVSPHTRSPVQTFDSNMMSSALNDSATIHSSYRPLAYNPVHPLQTGKYLELNGQVVIAFPVQAQVSDLPRLNTYTQFLYPSAAANSWILGPPFDALYMATYQATGQEDSLPPHQFQSLGIDDQNNIAYRDQGYNAQANFSEQDLNMLGSWAVAQEDRLSTCYPQVPVTKVSVTNGRNDIIYENQGYNPQDYTFPQGQQQQGPSHPLVGEATRNTPADSTFSYSDYLLTSRVPIQDEREDLGFDFDFEFDNLNNKVA